MVFIGQKESESCKDGILKVIFIILLWLQIFAVILCIDLIVGYIDIAPDTTGVLGDAMGLIVLNEFPTMAYYFYQMKIEKSEVKSYESDNFMRLEVH